jgi:hypothetical protein
VGPVHRPGPRRRGRRRVPPTWTTTGASDFVGHDDNRDGYIDRADYDKDHDGRLETYMADVDGDGWMDRTVVDPTVVDPAQGLRPRD